MKRLKDLREDHDLTQSQLAEIIHQSKSNISKYENGQVEPNIQTIIALADYFHVTTDYLLGVSDVKNPNTLSGAVLEKALQKSDELHDFLQKLQDSYYGKK